MKRAFLFGLIMWSGALSAQSDSILNLQEFWWDFNLGVQATDRWYYGGDAGLRSIFSGQDGRQFYIRPTARYVLNSNATASFAAANFTTWGVDVPNTYELRFHQELDIDWPRSIPVKINHRFRLEERFLWTTGDERYIGIRPRYLLGVTTQTFDLFKVLKEFYFIGQGELFAPVDISTEVPENYVINNIRLHLAIGQYLSEQWRYEFHYIWQNSRILDLRTLETTEHLLRLRIYFKS